MDPNYNGFLGTVLFTALIVSCDSFAITVYDAIAIVIKVITIILITTKDNTVIIVSYIEICLILIQRRWSR